MALKVEWHGVYPAVPTQFHDDLSLDIPNTKNMLMLFSMKGSMVW